MLFFFEVSPVVLVSCRSRAGRIVIVMRLSRASFFFSVGKPIPAPCRPCRFVACDCFVSKSESKRSVFLFILFVVSERRTTVVVACIQKNRIKNLARCICRRRDKKRCRLEGYWLVRRPRSWTTCHQMIASVLLSASWCPMPRTVRSLQRT